MTQTVTTPTRVALTAGFVAAATGGVRKTGEATASCEAVSIDSRTAKPGDAFVAVAGERFDGHRFVRDAVAAGACGVVVSDASALAGLDASIWAVQVADTTRALQDLAREVRRASRTTVVGVTGSAGKTTTKELTADLLALRFRVFRSQGNFNNHIGLPLSLLNLRHGFDLAVVELGMNHAGEIGLLTGVAEPDVRVWLNVSEVHTEFFASLDAVADAKAEILEGASSDTLIVANAADPRVMARVTRSGGRVVTFGIDVAADVRADDVRDLGVAGTQCLVTAGGGRVTFSVPLIGRGHLANALAAAAVATEFGVPLSEIAPRLAAATPAPRRGEVRRLRDGAVLIDDSYNSNPRALERMLQALAATTPAGRRFAVLGEMLELGGQSLELHAACGRAAAEAGLEGLIAVGGDLASALADGAVAGGMPRGTVIHLATSAEAADRMVGLLAPGDVVLVKGSRGVRTDIVADRIAAAWAAPSGG